MLKTELQAEIQKFYKGKLITLRLSGFILTLALFVFISLFFLKTINEAFACVGLLYLSGLLFNVFASLNAIKQRKVLSVMSTMFSIILYLSSLALMIWHFTKAY